MHFPNSDDYLYPASPYHSFKHKMFLFYTVLATVNQSI